MWCELDHRMFLGSPLYVSPFRSLIKANAQAGEKSAKPAFRHDRIIEAFVLADL